MILSFELMLRHLLSGWFKFDSCSLAVMHHKRNVSLSEDDLRTGKSGVSRLFGSLRTLVINLLEGMNVKNMAAQIDTFADKFATLIQFLTQQMVL